MSNTIIAFSEESEVFKGEYVTGYKLDVPIPKHESEYVEVKIIESSPYDIPTPYMYTTITEEQRKLSATTMLPVVDKIQYEALKIVADAGISVSDWAEKSAKMTEQLWSEIKNHRIGEETELTLPNGRTLSIITCSNYTNKAPVPDIEHMDESGIDFYLTNDDIVQDGDYITKIAIDIVNYEKGEKVLAADKQHLQEFYDKNIYPIRNLLSGELTEKQIDDYGYYSDRHKELYGFRPRDNKHNVCYQEHMKKERENNDRPR